MAFREVTDIQLDEPQAQSAAPRFREVQDIQLDAPQQQGVTPTQSTPLNPSKGEIASGMAKEVLGGAGNVLARTGRIATGIAGSLADLPVTVAQSAYDTTRGVQSQLGADVAPAYKIPLPSEGAKALYDVATGGAGKATGTAGEIDRAAETIVPLAAAGMSLAPQLAKKALPAIEESIRPLAKRAQDFGIPLSIDQIAPSRVRNTLQKVSQELPLSGVEGFQQAQTKSFNKALAKTIGQDSESLDPATIKKYLSTANEKFGSILTGEQINVPSSHIEKINNIREGITRKVDDSLAKVVQNNIDDVLAQIKSQSKKTGVLDAQGNMISKDTPLELSGEKLASIRSTLMDNAADASGGAKKALNKVVGIIDDIASKNLTAEKAQQLATARREYRNFKTLQPLLQKSADGNINPTQLINRIGSSRYIKAETSGVGQDDLVDLARIGKQFLSKKGGSDTIQKGLAGAGVATLLTNPVLALKGAGVVGANRLMQAANQSQGLVGAALNKRAPIELNPLLTGLTAGALNPRNNLE